MKLVRYLTVCVFCVGLAAFAVMVLTAQSSDPSVQSSPPDLTTYSRDALPADNIPLNLEEYEGVFQTPTVVDVVVNNTDTILKTTDTFNDGEPAIAVNPSDPNEIVITAFSGSWGANAPIWHSTRPTPKFGTVNALLGGVLHAAVDPSSGDVYYVYGNRDSVTTNNRIAIRRLQTSGGMISVGSENFVTDQVQAALPSVAVADNGVVGVFFYTFDGTVAGVPQFTAHLSLSQDRGATFADRKLETFLSSATDSGNSRQRVLGDYVQIKSLGRFLYGTFTGNGVPFGRTVSNHDPIFYKQSANRPPVAKAGSSVTVPAGANFQATVTLNGSASSDPDGDTLKYTWTGPFGIASGVKATVTLPLGTNVITLTVTDPFRASAMDMVTIKVVDNTPPTVGTVSATPDTL